MSVTGIDLLATTVYGRRLYYRKVVRLSFFFFVSPIFALVFNVLGSNPSGISW